MNFCYYLRDATPRVNVHVFGEDADGGAETKGNKILGLDELLADAEEAKAKESFALLTGAKAGEKKLELLELLADGTDGEELELLKLLAWLTDARSVELFELDSDKGEGI